MTACRSKQTGSGSTSVVASPSAALFPVAVFSVAVFMLAVLWFGTDAASADAAATGPVQSETAQPTTTQPETVQPEGPVEDDEPTGIDDVDPGGGFGVVLGVTLGVGAVFAYGYMRRRNQ